MTRPGHAAVRYDDLRGEVAADFIDEPGYNSNIESLAYKLGWKGEGRVVGIKLGIGERKYTKSAIFCFNLTVQVAGKGSTDDLKSEIRKTGKLVVDEYVIKNVDIADVVKEFKMFEIGLFTKMLRPSEIEVKSRIECSE